MILDGGYVRSYRRVYDNPVFHSTIEACVFVWMYHKAAWREINHRTRYGTVVLRRGEILVSEGMLVREFGLHRNTLRALLARMISEGMLVRMQDRCPYHSGTVYWIANYDEYQGVEGASAGGDWPAIRTRRTDEGPTQDRSGAEIKEGNQGKDSNPLLAEGVSAGGPANAPAPEVPSSAPGADEAILPKQRAAKLVDQAVATWNRIVGPKATAVKVVTAARRKALRQRLEKSFGDDLGAWTAYCERIARAPFLTGHGDRGWKVSIDFAIRESGYAGIIEGKFDELHAPVTPPAAAEAPQSGGGTVDGRWASRATVYRADGRWRPEWGPPPWDPDCAMPRSLIEQLPPELARPPPGGSKGRMA